MKWLKYILLFAVWLLLMLPSIVHIQYSNLRSSYEQTVQERLGSKETITVTIAKDEIVWVKKGKEILLSGKYFDTKNIVETKDHLVITGWYDDEDTALAKQYDHIKNQKKSAKQTLSKLLTVDYTAINNDVMVSKALGLALSIKHATVNNLYQFEFQNFLNKPPLVG